jgi:FkbH-like protein
MTSSKKCIVWDLDNTLWDGICLEGDVKVRPAIRDVLSRLDQKGIVHSIASRNEKDIAIKVLHDQNMLHFFVTPKINWLPKTTNIIEISKSLNLSLDSLAFVDDDPFELNQVQFMLPDVLTIDSKDAGQIADMPEFNSGYFTIESKSRREFYQADEKRKQAEHLFSSREEFLISCEMNLTIRLMQQRDIPRVLELMTRTHQLNTTGQIFEKKQLRGIAESRGSENIIFVAELRDKFGWNGIIGTAVIKCRGKNFNIVLFAMSCRILGRGIERAFLATLVKYAIQNGYQEIQAMYKDTGRNSMMRALYQMSGFIQGKELSDQGMIFTTNDKHIPETPRWVEVS